MKKIVASVGLVAIGAAGLQTASAQLGVPDTSKPWSVSATLRGFYDDNVSTLPNNFTIPAGEHRDSFGFEVSPSAALAWSVNQTVLNLGVMYSYKWYENEFINSTDRDDHTFTFNAGLNHAFTENAHFRVNDSFVIGQEPDLLRAGNVFSTFQRISGDNIRNHGSIGFDDQITPVFGVGLGYDNAYYDYDAVGWFNSGGQVQPNVGNVLNRIEHRAHLEGLFQLQPETKGLIGYQFGQTDFTENDLIGGNVIGGTIFNPVFAEERNRRQHTGYVGLEHNFTPELNGTLRVGASYADYYNDDAFDGEWTPFVNATLRYAYAPESYIQGGFSYDRSATDVVGFSGASSFTQDSESAVVFASITHRIVPNLFGSLMGQFQNSVYNGGIYNEQDEQYYLLGLDLEYRISKNFSTHVGYNYDRLESNLGRTFDRNRVYIGVTASY